MKKIFVFLCVSLFIECSASVEDSVVFDVSQLNSKSIPRSDNTVSSSFPSPELKRIRLDFSDDLEKNGSGKFDTEIEELAKKLKDLPDIESKYHDEEGGLFSYREERICMDTLLGFCYSRKEVDYLASMQNLEKTGFDDYCNTCCALFFACLRNRLRNYSACILQALKGLRDRIESAPWEIIDDDHYEGHEEASDNFLKSCQDDLDAKINSLNRN